MAALYLACILFSTWMILLMTGWIFGGLTHLLLILALVLFPWRRLGGEDDGDAAS